MRYSLAVGTIIFGAAVIGVTMNSCGGSASSSAEFSNESVISSPFSATSSTSYTMDGARPFALKDFATRKSEIKSLLDASSADACKFTIELGSELMPIVMVRLFKEHIHRVVDPRDGQVKWICHKGMLDSGLSPTPTDRLVLVLN